MKKRELMEFIDKVERKAVYSIKDKFNAQIQIEKSNVLKNNGYVERISKIQNKVNELFIEAQALYLDMKEDVTTRYDYYNNTATKLSDYTGGDTILTNDMVHCNFDGGSVERIRYTRDEEIKAIKDNYGKVRVICESYSSANKIAEYLKELGFDLSTMENKETQALTVKIDKTKLFVCGENK